MGTDITYLPTAAGWVYLAVVLDLFSRKVRRLGAQRVAGHRTGQRGAPPGG
jgi:transposase InsO family protein